MKHLLLTLAAASLALPATAQRRDPTEVWEYIRKTYDKDGDGKVTAAEHGRGERSFANLDRDGDEVITAADFGRRGRAGGRRQPEAAEILSDRFGSFLNRDGKPGIDRAEWKRVIATLQPGADGRIPPDNFRHLLGRSGEEQMAQRMKGQMILRAFDLDRDRKITVDDLQALFRTLDANGDGNIEQGAEIDLPPGPGEAAPDFTLPFAKGEGTVTLSSFKGVKPVGLIFGSYT